MVIGEALLRLTARLVAVQDSAKLPLEQLDPPRRAAVVMAILALVLTGMALVACVMIGGRWVRRLARHEHGRTKQTTNVENQRLRTALEPILPAGQAGETVVTKRNSNETVGDS